MRPEQRLSAVDMENNHAILVKTISIIMEGRKYHLSTHGTSRFCHLIETEEVPLIADTSITWKLNESEIKNQKL